LARRGGVREALPRFGPTADLPQGHRLARLQIQLGGARGLRSSFARRARALPRGERLLVEELDRARNSARRDHPRSDLGICFAFEKSIAGAAESGFLNSSAAFTPTPAAAAAVHDRASNPIAYELSPYSSPGHCVPRANRWPRLRA